MSRCEARWPLCTWQSMKPGDTSLPRASISRSTRPSNGGPTWSTRSSSITTTPSRHSACVPRSKPTTHPPVIRVRTSGEPRGGNHGRLRYHGPAAPPSASPSRWRAGGYNVGLLIPLRRGAMPESKREIIVNVARLHQHMDRHRLAAVVARSGMNFTYLSGLAYPGIREPRQIGEVHPGARDDGGEPVTVHVLMQAGDVHDDLALRLRHGSPPQRNQQADIIAAGS